MSCSPVPAAWWGQVFGWAKWSLPLCLGWMLACSSAAADLEDFETPIFSGAGNCAFCHDQWGRGLTDKRGNDVSIASDWRGTMMAHSFKDPLWRAVMEAEVAENPKLGGFIENKCQSCHAPSARAQARADGTNEITFAAAISSPLAQEGVGCTLCHQIQSANLGAKASFTGQFSIGSDRLIYGPYDEVVAMPMLRHVDYTPVFGAHTAESGLCATCHTLFTPVINSAGEITGTFPEQVPYLEWRNSAFPGEGKHCQDCHLPRLNEPIKISSRPPWLNPRQPFWRHQFAGGNAFMLSLLSQNADTLEAAAEPDQFEAMIAHTRAQLQSAAKVGLTGKRHREVLTVRVEVQNLTGHKFPTGHPYRRAWIHLRVLDRNQNKIFESGAVNSEGRIIGLREPFSPHVNEISRPDQVQIYQGIMADSESRPTFSLLRAVSYLKDNRLPPRGFNPQGEDRANVAVRGVEKDADFHRKANGRDTVTYRIELPDRGPVLVEARLLYQAVPPEAVVRLIRSEGPAARQFTRFYSEMDKTPELVGEGRKRF